VSKREFLRLLGLVLLSGSARASGTVNRDEALGKKRTLVIGAGLAGLAAARELKRHGHEVLVLEARDRLGGRIWTSNKWPDMPLDFGASWIHGVKGNPITGLADELKASRLITSYERAAVYNTSGQLLTQAEEARMENIRKRVFALLRKAQDRDEDTSVRRALAELIEEFKNSQDATRFLNFCLSGDIEQEYSGNASQLSAHWYDSGKEFERDDALFAQGFRVIIDFLARDIDIKLSQVVKEIHRRQSDVRVITQTSEFVADNVVVTLPLGVLQSNAVRFMPELSKEKRNAIEKLGMGVLNKCYLRFPRAFWPHDVDWLGYVSAQHGDWTEWVSFQRVAKVPILLGFNAADRGREIETLSNEQIVESAMQTLKTIFGAGIPQPTDYQITRWATDPFARGSYSYNAYGSTPEMRNILATSLNRQVFFAGEATHKEYFGTAHGAYLSGLRAAKDVLAV
jgi:monoamine oxidase